MEEKIYQGFVYRRAGPGQPWQQAGPARQQAGRLYADPNRAREQERKDAADRRADEDQDIQRKNFGLSVEDNRRSDRKEAVSLPQELRKEYSSLPEVKGYRIAAQMASSALNTAPNPQGDIALTYAFAKVMDPESVVRDQEANMVTNSQPWFQSSVENIKKQFGMDGAGNFTAEARARLRQEIVRTLASRKPLYDARRAEMTEVAMANGIQPAQVIGRSDTEVYAPGFRSYAEKNGDPDSVIATLIGGEPIKAPQSAQKAAGYGAKEGAIPIPPEMEQAHDDYLTQNWGKLDPRDYAAFRVNLDRKYGFGSNPEGYASSAAELNKAAAAGAQPNGAIPAVKKELSGVDQFRNNMLSDQYGIGAGVASGLNAAGLGIPSLFAREQSDALRREYPVQSFAGDVGGGLLGTGVTGGLLKGAATKMAPGGVAEALANPLTADIAYGAIYGATQADDPLYGGVGGGVSAFLGNRLGRGIGRAFPGATGVGGAIRQADETVPTSQALRDEAAALYTDAEVNGLTATPDETFALADRMGKVLSQEGVMSPTGRLSDVSPHVKDAYKLIEDYAGDVMTPKQIQTVRGRIADGMGSNEPGERRIAKLLMNDFDEWTDATNPALASGLAEARGVASRYLQGDKIAQARELADVRAGQFSNSGQGNALRTDFRQLDRAVAKGQESFTPPVEAAIADVARGNSVSNFLRNVGRFAPTGPVSSVPTLLAATGGYGAAGPMGLLGGAALAGGAFGARELSQRLTSRSAQVAENLAYGGQEYGDVLTALLEDAATRGGHGGAVLTTEVARALADATGY